MHTKDLLAAELQKAGLPEMAAKARDGHYHDYLSPLALPTYQLAIDLSLANTPAARALHQRVMDGEFDASKAEAEEWAASPDGRATFREFGGKPK